MMVMNRSTFISEELNQLDRLCRRRTMKRLVFQGVQRIRFQDQDLINFSSNDYLGMSQHPRIKMSAQKAISIAGTSTSSSRLICGNLDLHEKLESKLAILKGKDSSLVFASGFTANVGLLSSLVGEGDHIFSDALNHASIIDGCRLSRATTSIFRHGDLEHLENVLKNLRATGRRLVVSDSVFSMDGELADVPGLVKLCEQYDCCLMLDEAHATGVMGSRGGGLVEYFQDRGEVHPDEVGLLMGTLSKALGSFGGFIASSSLVRDYLINKCRSFIFSTALPPSAVGAALASLEIVRLQPSLREKLWKNVGLLRKGLEQNGFFSGKSETPIFPVLFASEHRAMEMSERLLDHGFFVAAIRPPSVPRGTSRLRITVTASHSSSQIEGLVHSLAKVRETLGVD